MHGVEGRNGILPHRNINTLVSARDPVGYDELTYLLSKHKTLLITVMMANIVRYYIMLPCSQTLADSLASSADPQDIHGSTQHAVALILSNYMFNTHCFLQPVPTLSLLLVNYSVYYYLIILLCAILVLLYIE